MELCMRAACLRVRCAAAHALHMCVIGSAASIRTLTDLFCFFNLDQMNTSQKGASSGRSSKILSWDLPQLEKWSSAWVTSN